jgi:hypothetical protein
MQTDTSVHALLLSTLFDGCAQGTGSFRDNLIALLDDGLSLDDREVHPAQITISDLLPARYLSAAQLARQQIETILAELDQPPKEPMVATTMRQRRAQQPRF